MSIISLSFMAFTTTVLLGYFIMPMKLRPYWLLISGIFFYSCFDIKAFFFLGFSVISTFVAAHLISLSHKKRNYGIKKIIALITIICNIMLLVIVKYFNYSIALLNILLNTQISQISIIVPLGIAFYTMQSVSYCVDVYKGKYPPESNFFKYLLYMTFFPIIMQGPISRYDQLADQLFTPHHFSFDKMRSGLSLVLWGLFKKMVIADRAAILVNQVFGSYMDYRGLEIIIAAFMYTIQIYTDFSGCVDICRGISHVLDIELIDNFEHPYFSTSIKDFWRRWHISLSSWFRDYIYIPLGGSRNGRIRKYVNIIIVFIASGLWHGVGIHYIAWGLLHGMYQIIGDITASFRTKLYDSWQINRESFSFKFGQQLITFILISISWVFFRAQELIAALSMLKSAFTYYNPWILTDGSFLNLGLDGKDWNVFIASLVVLLIVSLLQNRMCIREKLMEQTVIFRYTIYILAILSILIFGVYGPGYDPSQFIYMQF